MIITCWGSRGSIPVSGSEYLRYGGDTTCLEIRSKDGDILIVDAGTGIRKLGNKLLRENRQNYHIIYSHMLIGIIFWGFRFSNRSMSREQT